MPSLIESIESRTLFAANVPEALIQLAEASSSSAVQATLDLVKSDLTAINNSRGGNDAKAELQQIIDAGFAQLSTARDALRAVRDTDPATRQFASETLKSTRAELKSTLSAARANLRSSAIENRVELRTATTSLRQHLKQLRADLRNAVNPPPQQTPSPNASSNRPVGSGVTGTGKLDITSNAMVVRDVNVKYTYFGDADLNGSTDLDDLPLVYLNGLEDDPYSSQMWTYGSYSNITLDGFPVFGYGLNSSAG